LQNEKNRIWRNAIGNSNAVKFFSVVELFALLEDELCSDEIL